MIHYQITGKACSKSIGFSDFHATLSWAPIDKGTTETRSYYLTPATEDASELFWRLGVSR
jgi:hypothetical protein